MSFDIESNVLGELPPPSEFTVPDDSGTLMVDSETPDYNDEDDRYGMDLIEGYSDILNHEVLAGVALAGNESVTFSVLQLYGVTGNESWTDTIKKSAETVAKGIMEVISSIRDYFKKEGAEQVKAADARAQETVKGMAAMNKQAPLPEESSVRNPLSYFKGVAESVQLESLYTKYPELKSAMDKVKESTSRVKNAQVVGQLGAVYQDMRKNASAAGATITTTLEKVLGQAEAEAKKITKVEAGSIGEQDKEAQSAFKTDHKASVDNAKSLTKEAKLITTLRNRIAGTLNKIATVGSHVKGEQAPSEFKG